MKFKKNMQFSEHIALSEDYEEISTIKSGLSTSVASA